MNGLIGGVSRARCQDLQGTLRPCPSVKLKDKMLQRKDSNWAGAQVSQRGTSSTGISSSSWKEEKISNLYQAVPNPMGYLEPLEDSTWSQNVDSAASMYPPPTLPLTLDLDAWGEDYQDLSSWCSTPPQDMVADKKGSSCTVQDDELNTPELGVQHEFDFTASCNVLKENNTLLYLSEGSGISPLMPSPPLYVPEKSSLEESVKKTDTDNTRSATSVEFFIDDSCVLSVSHEEEIVTSHNVEGLNLEELVQTKEPVNLYGLGIAHRVKSMNIDNHKSVGKDTLVVMNTETNKHIDVTMANCDANTDKIVSLGSQLGTDFCVGTEEHMKQLRHEENLNLKNLLSGGSYHTDEIKNDVETSGCSTVVSKVTDTVVPRKCEIIRRKANRNMMMETVGPEEGAVKFAAVDVQINATEFAGQDTTPSMFRMDIPIKMEQQSEPMKSEPTETTRHVEITSQSLSGVSLDPQVVGTHTSEDMLGGNLGMLPHISLKEENATDRNLKLNLPTLWEGIEDSSINISTPDVMELLVKQTGNFDLIAYLFSNPKELQQDLVPANGDDRSYESCTAETIKAEPMVAQTEQSPNDAELSVNTDGDVAVKVQVLRPLYTARSDTEQGKSMFEPVEMEEVHCSPKHTSDQLIEEKTRTNLKKDLKGKQGHRIRKVTKNRNNIKPGSTLESRILQDSSDLRLKITKVKASTGQTSSTNGTLPQEQMSPKEHASESEELPLSKRTRKCPAKRALSATSEEKNETYSTNRSPRRRLAYVDGPWSPSKRTRQTPDEPCERYRELRDKNNEASRKSRQNRKVREVEMKEYAAKLESENQTLKIKADEMERLVKKLREALLEAVVKTKKA